MKNNTENTIILKRLAIVPTLDCTLNCKLCSNYMPYFKNINISKNPTILELKSDIDNIFNIIDYIEWLQFVGGELFLRKDISEVYRYCFKYKKQFNKLIFMTNATIMPCKNDLEFLKEFKNDIQIHISDYGNYSYKINELTKYFDDNDIDYVIKKYYGSSQYCGGWLDNTNFSNKNITFQELNTQFNNCAQMKMENFHIYRGILQGCARSLFATLLGKIKPNNRDFVDLNDKNMSINDKKNIIKNFNSSPRESCKSCIGFNHNNNATRYPAAEQL